MDTTPLSFRPKRAPRRSTEEYVKGILDGDRVILSQAITLVESHRPAHEAQAREIVEHCLPHSGNSVRLGITGVPGVGKSTFIEALGKYLTSQNHQLAVLAVDPSSQRSGGSILGDKTRMEELSIDPKAYIRPSPSAGSLGGVAKATRETIILCEAAGFDVILVETVGVGQSEIAVHSMVDFFLLLMLAGAGDELQGIKRGIMEMADALAINKADGDNVKNANRAQAQYSSALHLFPPSDTGWIPKVVTCSALEKQGMDRVWNVIDEHHRMMKVKGWFEKKRSEHSRYWMLETIREQLGTDFFQHEKTKKLLPEMEAALQEGKISSYAAAMELLNAYRQA